MSLRFGTSGLRGLVSEMTDAVCYRHAQAFARHLAGAGADTVAVGGDLRSSTPRILRAVLRAVTDEGLAVDFLGLVPTPALALQAMAEGAGGIMVTGSHIPDDRNGIKFYMPAGEILKADEQAITRIHAGLPDPPPGGARGGLPAPNPAARARYRRRFAAGFPPRCLDGLRLVCYQHSTVARELMPEILEALGAEVIPVGWSETFVPVDTEAVVDPERLAAWVRRHDADGLVSADGDGDRPLVVDETGAVVRGDRLGILVASFLHADSVAAPVSCNTALERCGRFPRIRRTRIGSPYVIAAMRELAGDGHTVVGYEANGGFLTGSDLLLDGGLAPLTALPTRDALLPILCLLAAARQAGQTLSRCLAALPPRHTASGLLRPFPSEKGWVIVQEFIAGGAAGASERLGREFGPCVGLDASDGARMTFENGEILHLRPSGNAPEFRCYAEADTPARAEAMIAWFVGGGLTGPPPAG